MAKIGEIVQAYLKIYDVEGGEIEKAALARLILKENTNLYPNLKDKKEKEERIRDRIRYYLGKLGDANRKVTGHIKTTNHAEDCEKYSKQRKERELKRLQERGGAKILIYDIETLPLVGPLWRIWNENISHKDLVVSEWKLCTWAAKWLFEDKIYGDYIKPEEVEAEDDSRILKSLCNLIEEADIIVAHNGNKFDIRQVNSRRVKHNLPPMLPYQMIDTLLSGRRAFDLPSHSLAYYAKFFGVEEKLETGGMKLWMDCLKGDKEAIQKMYEYNIQDIKVQEDVYLRMRPYIKPHPNIGLYIKDNVFNCPTCGDIDLNWDGEYATYANTYSSFRCNNCGAIGRSRNTNVAMKQKRFLTMSIPK